MLRIERAVVVAVALGLSGCGAGGGPAALGIPEGGTSPEQAIEALLTAAQEAVQARRAGRVSDADRGYEQMAAMFGTESGSIRRSRSAEYVRNWAITISTCLRPSAFRILTQSTPQLRATGRVSGSFELSRGGEGGQETFILQFRAVRGRGDRWFIDLIDLSDFTC